MTEQPEERQTTRYELRFEASGAVGKGDGPEALDVPQQSDQEEDET